MGLLTTQAHYACENDETVLYVVEEYKKAIKIVEMPFGYAKEQPRSRDWKEWTKSLGNLGISADTMSKKVLISHVESKVALLVICRIQWDESDAAPIEQLGKYSHGKEGQGYKREVHTQRAL